MIAKSVLNHSFSVGRTLAFLVSIYKHGKTKELLSFSSLGVEIYIRFLPEQQYTIQRFSLYGVK